MAEPHSIFRQLSRRYSTPEKVQAYLRSLPYNDEKDGETVRSAFTAYELQKAHCLEACFLASAILEHQDYKPHILYLDSKDHLGHCVYVFKKASGWGAIARSRLEGLHGREPRFRSLRDLVFSYYDPFIDKTGKLIAYSSIFLDDSGRDWRFSRRHLHAVESFIVNVPRIRISSSKVRFERYRRRYLEKGQLLSGPFWW